MDWVYLTQKKRKQFEIMFIPPEKTPAQKCRVLRHTAAVLQALAHLKSILQSLL